MQSINAGDSLTIALGGSPATRNPSFWGSYSVTQNSAVTDNPTIPSTVLNGATPVRVLYSPPPGTTFYLVSFTLTNTDTAAIEVHIALNGVDGVVFTLQPGDVLQFSKNNDSWSVLAGNGAVKQTLVLNWGQIGGTLSQQSDLQAALDAKASASTMATALGQKADSSSVSTALSGKADVSATQAALDLKLDVATNGVVTTTVNAGADQAVTLPATASLVGSASDDGSPAGVFTTTWSKVSGPGTVTFGDAAATSTTATLSVAGTYVIRLTANDGTYSTSDDMTVVAT